MPALEENMPDMEKETWQEDLQKAGFVRRLFQARKWYGADWWFVAISAVMVLGFIFVALFPQLLAPYSGSRGIPGTAGPDHPRGFAG
jgi:hypothetical protein